MYLICYGTRPEVIKLFPLIKCFQENKVEFNTMFTGQHKDLIKNFKDLIPKPDYFFEDIMEPNQSLNLLCGKILISLDNILKFDHSIRYIIVQGDTTSAYTIALAGFYSKLRVIHIEAGLRTYNKYSPFPEEINRSLISQIAHIHFTPTTNAKNNLLKENIKERVYNVGNTIVDAYNYVIKNTHIPLNVKNIITEHPRYIIITLHRRENANKLNDIWDQLNILVNKYSSLKFIYIKHPSIKSYTQFLHSNIMLLDPLDYISMVHLIYNCVGIISDSGGLQEEATCAKKNILICRDTTERPETIEFNYGKLVGTNILDNFEFILNNTPGLCNNPYGNNVSMKIYKELNLLVSTDL